MIEPRDYWERRFAGIDPENYDFSKSKPSPILASFCDRYLKDGDTVLDLGCGGGRNAHYLAQRGYKVHGVDISTAAIEFCKKRFARFNLYGTFKQGTIDCIPYPDNYFCGVICIAVIDHVTFECARVSITEIRRVLNSNGVILLTFDPPGTDEDILDEAEVLHDGTLKFIRGKQAGMLFRRYCDEEIKWLLGEHNIISFDYTENGTRVIICR